MPVSPGPSTAVGSEREALATSSLAPVTRGAVIVVCVVFLLTGTSAVTDAAQQPGDQHGPDSSVQQRSGATVGENDSLDPNVSDAITVTSIPRVVRYGGGVQTERISFLIQNVGSERIQRSIEIHNGVTETRIDTGEIDLDPAEQSWFTLQFDHPAFEKLDLTLVDAESGQTLAEIGPINIVRRPDQQAENKPGDTGGVPGGDSDAGETDSDRDNSTPKTGDETGPGFGVGVTVLALSVFCVRTTRTALRIQRASHGESS